MPSRSRRITAARVAAVVIAVGLGYRIVLIALGVPHTNSDEATMGLAASHIAEGRDFPVFFYGQHHMGALEAYLAAPLFAVFGSSLAALRLPLLPLYVAFCYAMFALARRLYTPWFAVAIVALLALGSGAVLHGEIFAGGGYPEIKPIGAGLLLLAVWLAAQGDRASRQRLLGYAAWGLLAGIALWVDWLILPYVVAAVAVLVAFCWRDLLGWPGTMLVAAVLVGALPSIVHHLGAEPGDSTLAAMLAHSRGGHTSIWARFYGGVLLGVPLASGLCGPGQCEGWRLGFGAVYPLLLLLAGVLAGTALRVARRAGPAGGGERVRQAGRLALVLAGAALLFAYARSDQAGATPGASVRYLSPLLISLPAVLWPLWSAACRLWRDRSPCARVAVSGLAAGALIAVVVAAMAVATVKVVQDIPQNRAAVRTERALVAALRERGQSQIYSEYWTCARIAFASRERVVCAALDDDLRPGLDRYQPFREAVEAADNPAYVLPIGSALERAFADRLTRQGIRFDVSEVAGYRIYQPGAVVGPRRRLLKP